MKDKSLLVVIISSFVAIIILLLIPNNAEKKEIKYQRTLYSSFKQITSTTGSVYKLASENIYGNNILNLLYYNNDNDDYMSFFIDNNTGKLSSFESLLKMDSIEDFNAAEKRLLDLKYPSFVVEGILKDTVLKYYRILDNEIIVYYKNVETTPIVNDRFYLKINNNEVKDYLNYNFKLDTTYQNEDGFSYDPTKKYIAFTFDDGPSKNNTKDIVNYLADNNAHATFFMVGNMMANNEDIVKYVINNGNEVGSHTYSHKNLKRITATEVKKEMEQAESVYYRITNNNFKLLRPPYGAINESVKENFNYSYILWNVDTEDWRYKDSEYLYNYVINHVNDGDIVLMHDIHETTKNAVKMILPELYARGYRVVSVSELAKIKGVSIEANRSYRSIK